MYAQIVHIRWSLIGRLPLGRRLNAFLGLSLNDRTLLFLVILFDKTVSVS